MFLRMLRRLTLVPARNICAFLARNRGPDQFHRPGFSSGESLEQDLLGFFLQVLIDEGQQLPLGGTALGPTLWVPTLPLDPRGSKVLLGIGMLPRCVFHGPQEE